MKLNAKAAVVAAMLLQAGRATAMTSVDLNGLWDFRFEENRSLEDVAKSAAFAANDKMVVSGCWNVMSHWFDKLGTGFCRTRFTLASDAVNAFLVVDGCGLRSKFWVDGREVFGKKTRP